MAGARTRLCAAAAAGAFAIVMLPAASERPAGTAGAQVAGLTLAERYRPVRIDSPEPTQGGNFGDIFTNVGDVNGDGNDDLVAAQRSPGDGRVFVLDGSTGGLIRTVPAPDPSTDNRAARFGQQVGRVPDLASCTGGVPGQNCPGPVSGPDGVHEFVVGAPGVDIPAATGTAVDIGRAYVIDGATGAVLKRLDVPPADLADQAAVAPALRSFGHGRMVLSPWSDYPLDAPPAVKVGSMDGDPLADIVVGHPSYFEQGPATNPACDPGPCFAAGRVYFYSGSDIVGTLASQPLDAPFEVVKNPKALTDDPSTPTNYHGEFFGHTAFSIGDVGKCNSDPGAGALCVRADSTNTADERADVVVAAFRMDFPADFFDAGYAFLLDGPTGSVLQNFQHPQPQPAALFGYTQNVEPAIGDVGSSTHPDVILSADPQKVQHFEQGRAYVMNGNIKAGADFVNFGHLDDPTPHNGGHFGGAIAGLGDVAGDPLNEVLIGAIHLFAGHQNVVSDVHVFEPLTGRVLLTIDDPDQEPGSSFGMNVAPMGDLNGDGAIDFAVGAPSKDTGVGDEGRIYIFRSVTGVERSVTLKLRRHLVASGTVTAAGAPECLSGVEVVITRKGKRVKSTTTDSEGRYRVKLRDKPGVYRATAPEVEAGDFVCERARSPKRRHRHG